jgi:hypothetical protein
LKYLSTKSERMRTSQKDLIANTIGGQGLQYLDFYAYTDDDCYILKFMNTDLRFIFRFNREDMNTFDYAYTRYNIKFTMAEMRNIYSPFESVLQIFQNWLRDNVIECQRDFNTPDPWSELGQKSKLFETIKNEDEGKPTPTERQEFKSAIDNFETLIKEKFKTSDESLAVIQKELNYLRSRVDQLNKRDLKSVGGKILYDIGVNLVTNYGVSKISEIPDFVEAVKETFNFFFNPKLLC